MEKNIIHSVYGLPENAKLIIFGAGSRGQSLIEDILEYRKDIYEILIFDSYGDGNILNYKIHKYEQSRIIDLLNAGYTIVFSTSASDEVCSLLNFASTVFIYEPESRLIYDHVSKYFGRYMSALDNLDEGEKIRIFQDQIEDICLEISNFCNRSCNYCPVSLHKSRKKEIFMGEATMDKVLNELATIGYTGSICLNVYNEPTANTENLLNVISKIKKLLPKSLIYFSTNGDYLAGREYLDRLFSAGLDTLYISLHMKNVTTLDSVNTITRLAFNLNLVPIFTNIHDNHTFAVWKKDSKCVYFNATNYVQVGMNRGELLPEVFSPGNRRAPCPRVFRQMSVYYDGIVTPCCNIFPEDDRHKGFICGNVNDTSLVDLYFSDIYLKFKRWNLDLKVKGHPCRTCSNDTYPISTFESNFFDTYIKNTHTQDK